ncbi:MAG: DUF1194 domain-containing protein [Tabrizicola sp.]|uniref:DUF1194 domain-containing protein n=1 Tax=Tabrizicola sp. TaxID=2005166 RepID=UPI0027362E29|nr:DUF1194 domain-containing protein [Tabrizicola sp.]MDP3263635.1 DUF1194 domain-containing protein [Tabrizicola sp.]MDP3646999.1 DUF1194 domain-containing protein [Paracoccaceae bacterium]MDZ4069843.1 DUF1194 domain-containing protein [Tabrizicola sp.]
MRGIWLPLCLCAAPASADCRLALLLAVDVSRSVDAADYVIQTEGLAAALTDPAVQAEFLSAEGNVALAVYYWSGSSHQEIVVPWVMVETPAQLAVVVDQVRARPRPQVNLPTALGWSLVYARDVLNDAPPCARQVLDVAGDGQNNDGISAASAYRRVDFGDVVVNGLAIGEHESGVAAYYRDEVIRGPGAFVEFAPTQGDYPRAIRRKLLRELRGPMLGAVAPQNATPGQDDGVFIGPHPL